MNEIDSKLRQLVHEMVDAAPPAGATPMAAEVEVREPPRQRIAILIAVAAAFVILIGGVVWQLARSDGDSGVADVAGDTAASDDRDVSGRSLAELGRDDWPFPRYLPEGMTLQETMVPFFGSKVLVFRGRGGTPSLTIQIEPHGPEDPASLEVEGALSGVLWLWASEGELAAHTGDGWIWAISEGLDDQTLLAIVESLVAADSSGLPVPPLDPESATYVRVAELLEYGEVTTLFAATNGQVYATRTEGEGDFVSEVCCGRLAPGELLSIDSASSGALAPGGVVLEGIADESVASIEIHLSDRTLITTEPQDVDDSFPVNFMFVAVPSWSPYNVIDRVVMFDAAGSELGRLDEGIGFVRPAAGISTVVIESGAASDAGTTDVVFELDAALPAPSARLVEEISYGRAHELTYTTQRSDDLGEDILVCGNTHQFPPPGIRTVDLLIPREWFTANYVPPDGPAGGPEGLAKIIICEPVDDIVQISIWGAASAQPEDVEVLVDGRTIRVEISATPTP